MKKFIFITVFLFSNFLYAEESADPNGYFKNKNWSWNIKGYGKVMVTSSYIAEPISKPNLMHIEVKCFTKSKKRIYPIVEDFKYCGINSISPAGKILVVYFADWDDKKASCVKKRVERIPLPDVCSKKSKEKK